MEKLEDQIKENIRDHRRFAQTAYDDHNECETHDARLITNLASDYLDLAKLIKKYLKAKK